MIRILLPEHLYSQIRLKLVGRTTKLETKQLVGVQRAYPYLEFKTSFFHEGFLENEDRLDLICEMLSDRPLLVAQSNEVFADMKTVLIEDADEIQEEAY